MNSTCFVSEVLSAPFVETQGMTNEQIYADLIASGKISLDVTLYYNGWTGFWDHTYGWTDLGDTMIHINSYFYGDAPTLGSTLLHEHSHTLGFTHNGGPKDQDSVPYSLNRIFGDCFTPNQKNLLSGF